MDPDSNPYSYFGYLYKQAKEKPEFIQRRNSATVGALLDEYFTHVLEQGNGKAVTLDIKYGHLHNFNPFWWPIYRTPFLLDYAGRATWALSIFRAGTVWKRRSPINSRPRAEFGTLSARAGSGAAEAIKVDKKQLLSQISSLDEQKSAVAMWTRNLRNLQILYEELTDPILGEECRTRITNSRRQTAQGFRQSLSQSDAASAGHRIELGRDFGFLPLESGLRALPVAAAHVEG